MKKTRIIKTELICSECGSIFPIMRKYNNQRETYHIKDLFCYKCAKETKFIELKDAMKIKKELEFIFQKTEFEQYLYDLLCMNDEKEQEKCLKKII